MFPNHPPLIDKFLQTKQDDILRELPDPATYGFQESNRFAIRLKVNAKVWVPVAILLVLAWWLSTII